jgi:hypothetical protein
MNVLDKETLLPLGAAITIIAAACGATIWLNTQLSELRTEYREHRAETSYRLQRIEDQVRSSAGIGDREMQLWIRLLKAENPTLSIPPFPSK